ncbi:MAG: DUF1801 domain-containing protein [Planctomycetota bacterium]|nr:DUF1801 domain-containing protein [Planctomycetota bacterium]
MPGILRFNGSSKRDPAIDAWLDAGEPRLGTLAKTWFAAMRRCGGDVRELMHDGLATACVEDAPFAYVGVFAAHINVGFFHGADLPDPAGLLQGTGKRMRHVKLRPGAAADAAATKALTMLIEAAYKDIKSRLADEGAKARIG